MLGVGGVTRAKMKRGWGGPNGRGSHGEGTVPGREGVWVLVGWPCTSWIKGEGWARDGGQGKPPEGMNTEER